MYISSMSFVLNQPSDPDQVNLVLTKKTMDVTAENSQAMLKMLELSANPNLGRNLDIRV